MNRFLKATAVAVTAAGGFGSVGCMADGPGLQGRYANYVDPCWPQRYNVETRKEVLAPFAAHVENGRVIEQTLFTYHFEPGTDKLNSAGLEKLDYLARRRPAPDPKVFVQTSRDIGYDATAADKYTAQRAELDGKRIRAVQQYLAASLAGRPMSFDVAVIDPSDVLMNAQGPSNSARAYPLRFQAGLAATGFSTGVGAGGGLAPGALGANPGSAGGGSGPGGPGGSGPGTGGTGR